MDRLALHPKSVLMKNNDRAILWKFLLQLHKRYTRYVSDPENHADNVTIQLVIDTYQDIPFFCDRHTIRQWPNPWPNSWPNKWPGRRLDSRSDAVVELAVRLARRAPPQDGLVEVVPILADGKIDIKGLLDLRDFTESAETISPVVIPKTIAEDAFMEGEEYF